MISKVRSSDNDLYTSLKEKGVEFIRCRPIKEPKTEYLKWELEVYKYNSSKGERVFCCPYETVKDFLSTVATHDFMVFDDFQAFIHNYNDDGLIEGGWSVRDETDIQHLKNIFLKIQSVSTLL